MKKILIIITLVLCIFQMVVLATAIDIGSGAVSRTWDQGSDTHIDGNNPANGSGTITTVSIWARSNLSDCEVATFYLVSGTNYSTRDHETIGAVTAGSKQDFTVSLDVVTGDLIGLYYSAGNMGVDIAGGSIYRRAVDNIPCADVEFTAESPRNLSIYGTGTTAAEDNVIFFGTNF